MLNTLDDYIRDSLPRDGEFVTNPALRKKVDDHAAFLPFSGNTAVFLLGGDTKDSLRRQQDVLYEQAGQMLTQRLDPATFHLTLHDLVNAPGEMAGLERQMAAVEARAKALLDLWRVDDPLKMQGTWLFNMVNTSVVLGLRPADAESWRRLDAMYCALEAVMPLGYALTPHITLAYYRPGIYSQQELNHLRKALTPVELKFELPMENLVLQTFSDMNHYETALTKK